VLESRGGMRRNRLSLLFFACAQSRTSVALTNASSSPGFDARRLAQSIGIAHLASKRSQKKLARAKAAEEARAAASIQAKRKHCAAHDATLVGEDCVANAWMDQKLSKLDTQAPMREHLAGLDPRTATPGLGRPVGQRSAPLPASLVGAHPRQLLANLLTCGEYEARWRGDPCAQTGDLLTPGSDPRVKARDTARGSDQWQAYICGPVAGRLLGYTPLHPAAASALGRFMDDAPLRSRDLPCLKGKRYLLVGDAWLRAVALSLFDAIKPSPRPTPFFGGMSKARGARG